MRRQQFLLQEKANPPNCLKYTAFMSVMLIEKIFALDGLGLLGYTALIERDFPLIISNMFIFTYIGLLCRLLSDIGYVIVDPRISYEGSSS